MRHTTPLRTLIVVVTIALIAGARAYQSGRPSATWQADAKVSATTSPLLSKLSEFRQSDVGVQYVLSPSGKVMLLGFNNHGTGSFSFRNTQSGELGAEFTTEFGLFYFMPDDRSAIVHGPRTITAWDVSTGKQLWSVPAIEERAILSTRGVIITNDSKELRLRAGDNGSVIRSFPSSGELLALSGDGSTLLVSTPNSSKASTVWVPAGTTKGQLILPKGGTAWRGALDRSGGTAAILVESSSSKKVHFWDLARGEMLKPVVEGDRVGQMALTDDGRTLILKRFTNDPWGPVVGDDGFVELWDVTTGNPIGKIRGRQFTLAPSTSTIAVNDGDRYQIWKLNR